MKSALLTAYLIFLVLSVTNAQDVSYLKDMPSSEKVLNNIKGDNELDAQYRQAASLSILNNMILDLSGNRRVSTGGLLPLEKRYTDDYKKSIQKIFANTTDQSRESQTKYHREEMKYEFDKDVVRKTLALLGPEAKKSYYKHYGSEEAKKSQTPPDQYADQQEQIKQSSEQADKEALIHKLRFAAFIIVGLLILFFIIRYIYKSSSKSSNNKPVVKNANTWQEIEQRFLYYPDLSKEEIDEKIRTYFDNKSNTVYFGIRWEFKNPLVNSSLANFSSKVSVGNILERQIAASKIYNIEFVISRSLAAMEPKEYEFLRTAYLLYNAKLITRKQCDYFRFALINGNGKALVNMYKYQTPPELNIRDAATAIKYYQDQNNISVDGAVSSLLTFMNSQKTSNPDSTTVQETFSRIHGGGAWLAPKDIEKSAFKQEKDYKLVLGNLEGSNTILSYSGEGSLITIAPPGSGKTQCFVIPNMLNWKGAAVVLDIKGEIYATTHKWRVRNIGKIYKFSPLDPSNSNNYNPLDFVRSDAEYIWEDSRFLAEMMIVPSNTNDPFWESTARDVLTSAIAYTCFTNAPNQRPMSNMLDIMYGIGWDEMITSLKTNIFVSAMRRMGHSLYEMEKRQKDSVLKTAQSSLSAWSGERIARVTNRSDWNPLDLRNGCPTIYICINPNEIDSYLSVLRVFIAQHIRMLTTELPKKDSVPVLFMLDELPRLKKMPPVDEALNIGRQYGIKLWMFAQSYGQLKEAYPNADGLVGSCAVRTFMNFPLNDELTTKISDQLGFREGPLDATKQKLVEPIELAGPNYRDTILVFATNTKPAKVKKKFAYEDKEVLEKLQQQ